MQVLQVASSSPLVLHVIALLFVLNTITRTQIFSKAEEKRVENKRGYFRHPGYFSGKFGHLYSAEDFFPQRKNGSIKAGISSFTTRHPLYRVSPAMFQQDGVERGSNLKHEALRGDATESEENYNMAKQNHELPHISTSILHGKNSGLKGNPGLKGRHIIAKLPQSIPYYEQNNGGSYKKGKGVNKPPVRFTIPPEYTKTMHPVHYTTEQVTMHPTTTENSFFTTWPTTSGFNGKGHHKHPSKFTIPPEFTQTITEPVHYPTEPVTLHPTTTVEEIFTIHPATTGVKKGKGHHKPASKFTIPPEYTRTTEPVHHQTEPVTSHPETTQEVYITQPTTSGVKKGKGHHKPATMFTIPPEFTQTTEPVHYPTEQVTMHPTTEKEIFTTQTAEPVYYPTEQVTMHPTTEKEIFTTHPPTSGAKGKGHHKPASKFTIPPEYTKTTEPVHYQTEPVTSHPETTQEVYITQPSTSEVKKGKGHHKPATMFTIPPEFTQTTEPVHYPTEPVTMHPKTTEIEIFTTHPPTSGVKKGKGHHKQASKFTIPPEYTRTTEPVHYQTEPETTQEIYITQPTTSGVKKGKGHHKPATMFTIPPEYTRTTRPEHYSTQPTNYPVTTEEIYVTQPTISWAKKGKGHHKSASKFTIPSEYTMTTQSINPSIFTTKMFQTFNPIDYDQSTLPEEFSTLMKEPHHWQTSTIKYPDTTHPYENGQSDDEQFTVPGYESTKPVHSEIGNPEDLVTKPSFFTEPPIKYEVSTPVSYQTTQSHEMQTDFQSTEFPHYEEFPSTYTNPSMQNTESSHYQTNKYTDFDQSTVTVEIPNESSSESPAIFTDSSMQNTATSYYHTDKHSDYDQATVPVEIITYQTPTKNPYYEPSTTQTGSSMQYTASTYYQTTRYIDDDDQVTVPVEIPTQQSTKYPHYQEFPTTHSDLSMQFTESSKYHSIMDMEDDQATVPVGVLTESSTMNPHYEDHSTTYSEPAMQYTESSYQSVKYSDDDQATVPVEILTESPTKYPHYEDHSTTYTLPSMQSTESFQYSVVQKHTDDDQATVPVEILSESSTKSPHYEFSTFQPSESSTHYTTLSHYHSDEDSYDQATVPVEVAVETTTRMESHHIESTSSFKQSTEFDSGLQAKVPPFPAENEEQHHLDVNFNDDDEEDDVDQQSITHPYLTHPKASTPANSPGELDWRSGSTVPVHVTPNKKYTVAPSDFFLTPIAPFKPVEFIPPQPYKEWPSHSALNNTGIAQVKVPDTIQVDLKGYPSYAENRPGIKGRGGRHNMISKPWYFMSRTLH